MDRPAIVFLDKGGHGHFVVVRPVGHTGRMVQVIDGGHSVEVVDRSAMTSRAEWTGLALVPSRGPAARRSRIVAGVASILVLGCSWFLLKLARGRRGAAKAQIRLPPEGVIL